MLDKLRKIFSGPPTPLGEMKAARGAIDVAAISARVAQAEAKKRAAQLGGDKADVRKADADLTDARLDLEQAQTQIEELDMRIAQAERAAAIKAWRDERDAIKREVADAAADIRREYPRLAKEMAALISQAQAANARAKLWNGQQLKTHPNNPPGIGEAEVATSVPSVDEVIFKVPTPAFPGPGALVDFVILPSPSADFAPSINEHLLRAFTPQIFTMKAPA